MPRSFAVAALLGLCVLPALPVRAVDYVWDPNGNRSDAAGSGSWNTTSAVWNTGTADVAWPNNTNYNPIFNGVDGNYTITVANGITAGSAAFGVSGYTLQGASAAAPGSLSLGSGNPNSLEVATGKTVTFGPNLTVTLGQYVNQGPAGKGTIAIAGGTVNMISGLSIGGGRINLSAGGIFTGILGVFSATAINVDGAGTSFFTSRVTFSNSTLTVGNGATATLAGGGSGIRLSNSTIQLNSGSTLSIGDIENSDANSVFKLNGGVLRIDQSYPTFPFGSTNAVQFTVGAGGAKIFKDFAPATLATTLPTPLTHDASGPAIDGGLTKQGVGPLALMAASTYTGGTTVAEGRLIINANGGLGSGSASVLTTGICLTISTGVTNPFNGTLAGLSLAGGGTANTADVGYLDLSSGANIVVGSLALGTTTYTSGVFTSINAPDFILGSGTITVIPEPGTVGLLLVAGVGLGVLMRRSAVR